MGTERSGVLAALNGTACDLAVAATAATLAPALGGNLVLLRVVRPSLPPLFHLARCAAGPADDGSPDRTLIDRVGRAVREAEADLLEVEAAVAAPHVSRIVLISSHARRRVLDWLYGHPIALVVVAEPRRPADRMLPGADLAGAIARSGLAPVLPLACRCGETEERRPLAHIRHHRPYRCLAASERGRRR